MADRQDQIDDLNDVWADRSVHAYGRFTDSPGKMFALGAGLLIAFILVMTLIANAVGIASIYWGAEKAKLTVKPRVTQVTYGTDNALRNISYFHDQCNLILADDQQVANAQEALKNDRATLASISDPIAQQQAGASVNQDESNLLGVRDQLANDVRDYDSKSATQTANPFKAAGLPYRIEIDRATGTLAGSVNCH